eukprot:g31419.t1
MPSRKRQKRTSSSAVSEEADVCLPLPLKKMDSPLPTSSLCPPSQCAERSLHDEPRKRQKVRSSSTDRSSSAVSSSPPSPSSATSSSPPSPSSMALSLSLNPQWPSGPAQSLDDDDPPTLPASSSTALILPSRLSHDAHAITLCKSLLSLPDQLKQLEDGHYAEEKPGSDVFELTVDRVRGSVEVRQVRQLPRGLGTATKEARERVANEINKRKQDIAGLEAEAAALNMQIRGNPSEEDEEVLSKQMYSIQRLIGKHEKDIKELERKGKVEVEVEVERVSTRIELVKEERVKVNDFLSALSTVEHYMAKEDKWAEVPACMTFKRSDCGVAVLGDAIYALGGWNGVERFTSVERFSATNVSWELATPMSTQRQGPVAGALNGNIYVAGGFDGTASLSSATRFDPTANRWEDMAPMSCQRAFAGAAVLDGRFYVLGGWDGENNWCTMERYNPVKNAWEAVAPMKTNKNGCAAAALNGCLYVMGGQDDSGSALSTVERYDPTSNRWQDMSPMTCARCGASAAVLDGRLYVMGGDNERRSLLSVERYDEATNRWELVSSMSAPRFAAAAAVV